MYTVYVIRSETSGRIYIGQTNNLEKRLKQHNDNDFDTRSFTKLSGSNWKIVYQENLGTRKEAMFREKQLKSHRGRDWIRAAIMGR